MNKFVMRFAEKNDANDILKIYAPYVINTSITFEYNPPTTEEMVERMEAVKEDYPYIVCELYNQIVGYAYAHRFMERDAYNWDVELSIYVDEKYAHRGIGKGLYTCILEILAHQNVKNVYSIITLSNNNSIRFHKFFNFKKIGLLPNCGYKLDKWHDVIIMGRTLGSYNQDPKQFIKVNDIEKSLTDGIFDVVSTIINNGS